MWVISFGGFKQSALDRAAELDVLVSSNGDLEAVKNVTATRRPDGGDS